MWQRRHTHMEPLIEFSYGNRTHACLCTLSGLESSNVDRKRIWFSSIFCSFCAWKQKQRTRKRGDFMHAESGGRKSIQHKHKSVNCSKFGISLSLSLVSSSPFFAPRRYANFIGSYESVSNEWRLFYESWREIYAWLRAWISTYMYLSLIFDSFISFLKGFTLPPFCVSQVPWTTAWLWVSAARRFVLYDLITFCPFPPWRNWRWAAAMTRA
jgi:hypothetical protein